MPLQSMQPQRSTHSLAAAPPAALSASTPLFPRTWPQLPQSHIENIPPLTSLSQWQTTNRSDRLPKVIIKKSKSTATLTGSLSPFSHLQPPFLHLFPFAHSDCVCHGGQCRSSNRSSVDVSHSRMCRLALAAILLLIGVRCFCCC